MSVVGNDIHKYPHGRFRVRVYRNHTRHYLGMFDSEEKARLAREAFLAGPVDLIPPKQYSIAWYKLQSDKQRILFSQRYFTNK